MDFNGYVAITGGIGSGKSVICQRLERRGIKVYDCDNAAKRLLKESDSLRSKMCSLVGNNLYADDILQKVVLTEFLLRSDDNKQAVNDIVHPFVADDFLHSGCHWLESAVLFESGFDKRVHFDVVICVTAPLDLRIKRIMERDHISEKKTLEWINCQMPQDEMLAKSNFNLVSGREDIEQQIDKLLTKIK
nr:dephospho-CoA kinase [Prevotella sp.]